MKKILSIFYLTIVISIFSACTSDEINKECFTCEDTLTEYCIVEGDDFYSISIDGATPQEIPLNGEFWNDIKDTVNYECGADCFTCDNTLTTYCYQEINDFYTIHIEGSSSTEVLLDGNSWEDIKAELIISCTDLITDCYTCEIEETEYCYTEGDDFYIQGANMSGDCDGDNTPDYLGPDPCDPETQIPLNGETWESIRAGLENNCPTIITASIVGVWTVTEYTGSKEMIFNNVTIATATYQTTSFDNYQWHFTDNPNELFFTGSFNLNTITNSNGVETEQDDIVNPDPNATETWSLNSTDLQISTDNIEASGATVEQYIFTVLELTDSALKLKADIVLNINGVQNIDEVFLTFER